MYYTVYHRTKSSHVVLYCNTVKFAVINMTEAYLFLSYRNKSGLVRWHRALQYRIKLFRKQCEIRLMLPPCQEWLQTQGHWWVVSWTGDPSCDEGSGRSRRKRWEEERVRGGSGERRKWWEEWFDGALWGRLRRTRRAEIEKEELGRLNNQDFISAAQETIGGVFTWR